MKKIWKKISCILLACSLFSLTGCLEDIFGAPSGDGFSGGHAPEVNDPTNPEKPAPDDNGGNNTENGGEGNEDEGQLPVIPVPDLPVAWTGVPETLDFTPTPVNAQYGYRYFYELEGGEKFCFFYKDLYDAAAGLKDSKNVLPTKENVEAADGSVSEVYLNIVEELNYQQYGLTADEAFSVWKVFRMEYPEFYWMSNEVTYGTTIFNVEIYEEYALGATRTQIQTDIENMANDCFAKLSPNMTETEVAVTVYDYVITTMEYVYQADGSPETATWAHNLVGMAQGGKGVCETYAKAFDYLTSLFGIETVTIGGKAGTDSDTNKWEGHAWNIMRLDGVWYSVDSTWGDQTNAIYREWFGKSNTEFTKTHAVDLPSVGYGKTWQYPIPALSEATLSPVRMSDGSVEKMYGCIDYALEDITNAQGEYTLTLHPHTSVTSAKNSKIYHSEVSFGGGDMPAAQKITFVGGLNGLSPLALRANGEVTLNSNIYLEDIRWTYPALNENGYTITKNLWSKHEEIRA